MANDDEEEPLEYRKRECEFTPRELLLIESKLRTIDFVQETQKEGYITPPEIFKSLALTIGQALVQATDNSKNIKIFLDENDYWFLRDKINIYEGTQEKEGLTVKVKIYKILLDINNQIAIGPLIEVTNANVEELSKDAIKQKMEKFSKKRGGRSRKNKARNKT